MLARNAARQVSASHQEIKSWSQKLDRNYQGEATWFNTLGNQHWSQSSATHQNTKFKIWFNVSSKCPHLTCAGWYFRTSVRISNMFFLTTCWWTIILQFQICAHFNQPPRIRVNQTQGMASVHETVDMTWRFNRIELLCVCSHWQQMATNSGELGQSERHYMHHYYVPAMTSDSCRVSVACSSYTGSCWDNKTLLVSLKPSLFCELIEHVQQTSMMRCLLQYRHMFSWKFLIHAPATCLQTLRLIKCY